MMDPGHGVAQNSLFGCRTLIGGAKKLRRLIRRAARRTFAFSRHLRETFVSERE